VNQLLDRVEFTNRTGNKLAIPFYDGADGYWFESVEGTDPVDAVIVSSSFANVDGEQYQSARRGSRNLVFKMGVDVSQVHGSVTQLRRNLMGLLMPKTEARLRFFSTDFPAVDIVGIVESFDWPLFAQEPEVTLSIICHQSDFVDLMTVVAVDRTTSELLNTIIDYPGSVETGITFRMLADRALDGFTIYHRSSSGAFSSLEFEQPLIAGDLVEICTISGEKEIMLTRAGTRSSILHAMSPYSNWIEIHPGANYFSVVAEGAEIEYTIEYVNRYGGL
jgi:Phage tail protein